MAHSFVCCYVHYVFSTKHRRCAISADLRGRLWPYLGGIARENRVKALAVGGTDNHVHLLVSLPSTLTIADAVRRIKAGSSVWVSETFPGYREFAWQEGYGAFTVNVSLIESTMAYIARQEEHHGTQTFEEEYLGFLDRHGVEYRPEYVFD